MELEEKESEGEEVMSEIHLGCPPRFAAPFISRFTFSLPSNLEIKDDTELIEEENFSNELKLDEDGDLVLDRRKDKMENLVNYEFAIQHNITSSLRNVGLQVWKAALILTDFILHRSLISSEFEDITAIELGAGTGLVGMVLSLTAKTVFITDKGNEVLDNCSKNIDLNSKLLNLQNNKINVRELDWSQPWPPSIKNTNSSHSKSKYNWGNMEIEEAERCSVIFAADVIYSDEITDLFFSTVQKLMSRGSKKVLYLALEKRYNFSLDEIDVVANGYSHFRSFLKDEQDLGRNDGTPLYSCFLGEQIDIAEIPQYIREYERGKDLEIWKITYCPLK
ncbi:hypothetical protein LUZ60_017149 [Juncus effusus]|nr:hypothetical protein LUZ60_017149 [Juncus effusus]